MIPGVGRAGKRGSEYRLQAGKTTPIPVHAVVRRALFDPAKAGTPNLDAVERGSGRDEEGFAVLAAENETGRALRDFDGIDLFATSVEDADLAGGDVDVALVIGRDAFAALDSGDSLLISVLTLAYRR